MLCMFQMALGIIKKTIQINILGILSSVPLNLCLQRHKCQLHVSLIPNYLKVTLKLFKYKII